MLHPEHEVYNYYIKFAYVYKVKLLKYITCNRDRIISYFVSIDILSCGLNCHLGLSQWETKVLTPGTNTIII